MTKSKVIELLRENGVKANYKNLAVCLEPKKNECSACGYCRKDGNTVAFFIVGKHFPKVIFKD